MTSVFWSQVDNISLDIKIRQIYFYFNLLKKLKCSCLFSSSQTLRSGLLSRQLLFGNLFLVFNQFIYYPINEQSHNNQQQLTENKYHIIFHTTFATEQRYNINKKVSFAQHFLFWAGIN